MTENWMNSPVVTERLKSNISTGYIASTSSPSTHRSTMVALVDS